MLHTSACPVCTSKLVLEVRNFRLPENYRKDSLSMLYYCIGCQSAFFCHEPRVGSSLAWHLKVRERNLSWSKELYDALGKVAILDSIIDIGCGIGTWLDYAKSRGSSVLGFETAQELVVYGENEYNLNLKCELFASSNQSANKQEATLITSISRLAKIFRGWAVDNFDVS
jgi:hypothetical protein